MSALPAESGAGWCPDCGKWRWMTRKAAKTALRHHKARKGRLHVYACGDFWHLGHPPRALIRGDVARDELPRRPGRGRRSR